MTGKRGNGEGSIRQRADGRWEARVSLGDGGSKSHYAKSRTEAARWLAATLRDRDKGLPVAHDERQSVETYLTGWLNRAKSRLRPTTHRRYSELVTLYAIPHLGRIALAKLSPTHIEDLYAQLLAEASDANDDDAMHARTLAPATVHQLHAILHHALKDALRKGVIQRNVCDLVDAPRVPQREMAALTPEQVDALFTSLAEDRLRALYILAVVTGMRQGELLALRWRNVNLEGAMLSVQATLHHDRDGFTFGEPKTAAGRRPVPLPPLAVTALRAHRARQAEERLALGAAWQDNDLVFADEAGGPLIGINVLRGHFYPLLERAGLPHVRFHDLRHTSASLLMAWKVGAKNVQGLLGHSSVTITLGTYSHVLPDNGADAAAAMERRFGHHGG